tara:strand:+ start:1044 stop:1649 length:606 start_codon:yes stop_codon:yes gene_type:complete
MANKEYIIKDLSSEHIDRISEIWLNDLPYNFKSIIGNNIIRNYLTKIFESKIILKKGIFKNNELIGFVFFGEDKIIIKELFIDNFFLIIKSFLKYMILLKFKYLIFYFNVAIFLTLNLFNKKKSMTTELLIIVINKEFHRKNLGSKLINESLQDSYFKNFKEVTVITLKKDIENINFYEKNNFKQFKEVYGRIFLKYDLPR